MVIIKRWDNGLKEGAINNKLHINCIGLKSSGKYGEIQLICKGSAGQRPDPYEGECPPLSGPVASAGLRPALPV